MQKKVNLFIVFLFMIGMLVVFAGCSQNSDAKIKATVEEQEKESNQPLIGFSLFDNTMPWAVAYSKCVFAEAEERGYPYIYTDAQNHPDKQVEDVQWLLDQGIELLVLTAIKEDQAKPCLEAAKMAGIPVFLAARKVTDAVYQEDYITRIGGDFYWEGLAAGEWLSSHRVGELKVVEISGTEGSSNAIDRAKGFRDAIEKDSNIEIVVSQSANFTRADAREVMEYIIQTIGKEGFNTVYAHSDEMAIGAIIALRAAGIRAGRDVTVVSIDGQKEAVQLIKDGNLNCTVTCTPIYNEVLFDAIDAYYRGEDLPPFIINFGEVVDINTVEEALKKAF